MWIDHCVEVDVWVELKVVGERPKALLGNSLVVPVDCKPKGYVSTLWVLAGKLNFQKMFPGNDVSDILKGGDLI